MRASLRRAWLALRGFARGFVGLAAAPPPDRQRRRTPCC
jgi:hypothetical protein